MKQFIYVFVATLLFAACSSNKNAQHIQQPEQNNAIAHGKLFTAAYQQHAAEYRALCFQAYNIAKWRVDDILFTKSTRPRAIVTDIDETLLDNSAYAVKQGLQNKDYETASWYEWTSLGKADTVPGALTFLKYAASKGIEIFYITNREEKERTGTLNNLVKFNFPNADNNHLILKQTASSKEARRIEVMKTHDIIMLLGDNLADFSVIFDKKNTAERNENVNLSAAQFGNRFIILPNPNYGDWEGALYRYNWNLTPSQKDSAIRASLKSY